MTKTKNTPAVSVTRSGNVMVVNFAEAKQPVYREMHGGTYVRFGSDNQYPEYLQMLFDNATKHGAITGGKATYVAGKGWQVKDGKEDANADAFIAKVNRRGDTLYDVSKRCALDVEIFGGAYVQVIWTRGTRRIAEIYHIDYLKMRSNYNNTQFRYRESWAPYNNKGLLPGWKDEKVYPAFNPNNPRGSQILFIKEYRPGIGTYPLPSYMNALNYIAAEVEVGKTVFGRSKSGFSASKSVTFTQGEPENEEQKKELTKKVEKTFTGSDGKTIMVNFVNNADEKPIIDDLGASDLTKEDFTHVDDLIQTNIFTGHRITTPILFGIATPGALGQRKEMQAGYEVFNNTYVNDKQQFLEKHFNVLAAFAGASNPITILPVDPIGIEFNSDTITRIAPKQWVLDKLGIDITKYPDPTPAIIAPIKGGVPAPEDSNGSGMRQKFTAEDDDKALELFSQYGALKSDFTIIKSRKVKMSVETEDFMEAAFTAFADKTINELEASILDLISKDKRITPDVLAETLKVGVKDIENALQSLEEIGAIETTGDAGEEVRTLTKPLKDLQAGVKAKTRSFLVRYSYEGPQDSKNRPFCAKMMELGRMYSRSDIESISAELGYSVWDRRGGFYTNPNTKETTPYCRHTWMSHVVMSNK